MFVGKGTEALELRRHEIRRHLAVDPRDFRRDRPGAEGLGHHETVVDRGVVHLGDVVDLQDVDRDAAIAELLAEGRDLLRLDAETPLLELGVVGRRTRGRGGRHRRPEEQLHRLRPQFHAADAEQRAVLDDLVAAHVRSGEAVRHVEADLHAVDLRVRLAYLGRHLGRPSRGGQIGEQARRRQRGEGDLGKFTTSVGRHGIFVETGSSGVGPSEMARRGKASSKSPRRAPASPFTQKGSGTRDSLFGPRFERPSVSSCDEIVGEKSIRRLIRLIGKY